MENNQKVKHVGAIVVLVLLAIGVAAFVRWQTGGRMRTGREAQLGREWSKLELILNQIQNNYVDSVDVSSFIEKTLPFIMEELDPHYIYLEPNDLKTADEELKGNIESIGILFNVPNDTATV